MFIWRLKESNPTVTVPGLDTTVLDNDDDDDCRVFKKANDQKKRWMSTDLLCQQAHWDKARHTIFSTLAEEDGPYVLNGICRDLVIIPHPGH